ncbi:Uncharacterised protein [uncultured archaeon]|nr:Uncharacterised protein [uncultured archaeon]
MTQTCDRPQNQDPPPRFTIKIITNMYNINPQNVQRFKAYVELVYPPPWTYLEQANYDVYMKYCYGGRC